MSIVALKRRAKLINNQSGKEPSARLIVRGPGQTEGRVITTGGGFSLNGPYRNIGYVGKNSLDSVGGTRMKPGTSTWKGSGGCCGQYPEDVSPNNQCCIDVSHTSKPSSLNTKGMLANKNRWTKRNIPAANFTANGATEAPDKNQIQEIYNNWVSTESGHYNIKKSAQQYTENLAASVAFKYPNKLDSGVNVSSADRSGNCGKGHHIGGKYVPSKTYSKFLNFAGSSNRAINSAIAKRASVFPRGYDKPFPFTTQPNQCIGQAIQGNDANVLAKYYNNENATTLLSCPLPPQ
jgi:hypothetical protein